MAKRLDARHEPPSHRSQFPYLAENAKHTVVAVARARCMEFCDDRAVAWEGERPAWASLGLSSIRDFGFTLAQARFERADE
ncbi:hypothetical protein CBOM_05603 [Ceraceosorus bombacis]|uniref:Uncharacterized protein n=1 Tax=Ceraceosorus bombacis TaxID=401625 RepID=A0A0P1BQZ6_9BASI|nr:hypothetical protein CBOM_05603 [Ceraceosorus bombacis]